LQNNWQAWDISLNDFKAVNPNLNLERIKKITLGVGHRLADPYGTGTMYFDDWIKIMVSGPSALLMTDR
jgi:hypothetical protein